MNSRAANELGLAIACLAVTLTATGCDGEDDRDTAPIAVLALPLEVAEPGDNPSSPAKVELGRLLFWDPVLSGDRTTAALSDGTFDARVPTEVPSGLPPGGVLR